VSELAAPAECEHNWEITGMVFETQMLDERGRVIVRQPDMETAKTYFICRNCATHTYMTTEWIGYQLYGSEAALHDLKTKGHSAGYSGGYGHGRPAWKLEETD
jgi:hypothetical protein